MIDKEHQLANTLINQVCSLRTAFQGFKQANEIINANERPLKNAVDNKDEEMIAAHSFQLWNAYDILTSVLQHNPNHDRTRESFSKGKIFFQHRLTIMNTICYDIYEHDILPREHDPS
ncbi:MAG: hypothetical protein GX957_09975 [Clostridiaceae bacterium]|nr:hypothetical protein [Clostridiaceae bacterium]